MLDGQMRNKGKNILWPEYLDSSRSRSEGRRLPKRLSVSSPRIEEIQRVIKSLGLEFEITQETSYPKTHWQKTGHIVLLKRESKTTVIRKIAMRILEERKKNQKKS